MTPEEIAVKVVDFQVSLANGIQEGQRFASVFLANIDRLKNNLLPAIEFAMKFEAARRAEVLKISEFRKIEFSGPRNTPKKGDSGKSILTAWELD